MIQSGNFTDFSVSESVRDSQHGGGPGAGQNPLFQEVEVSGFIVKRQGIGVM